MSKSKRARALQRKVDAVVDELRGRDLLAIGQRVFTFLRGVRGDSLQTVEADHRREMERSGKLQALFEQIENTAASGGGD